MTREWIKRCVESAKEDVKEKQQAYFRVLHETKSSEILHPGYEKEGALESKLQEWHQAFDIYSRLCKVYLRKIKEKRVDDSLED